MSLKDLVSFTKEPMFLMDSSLFVFKGYYGNMKMTRTDGFPTGAIYSVARTLLKILKDEQPKYFSFVQDGSSKENFRKEIYPLYKANRSETPEELRMQFEPIAEFVKSLGLQSEIAGAYEADDCIASLAKHHRDENTIIIVGIDKDLKQCLHPSVFMWDPSGKESKILTLDAFKEATGLEPSQWADIQAIIGDTSDNIPGIRGIGEKTAEKIFKDFPSLEAIRDNFDDMPDKIKAKFEGNLDAMFMYRELTTLDVACCKDIKKEDLLVKGADFDACMQFFSSYQMPSLQKEFERLVQKGIIKTLESSPSTASSPKTESKIENLSLFDTQSEPVAESKSEAKTKKAKSSNETQLSLLDMFGMTETKSAEVEIEIDELDTLPQLESNAKELELAFLPAHHIERGKTGFYIAYADKNFLYKGESANLLDFLKQFKSFTTFDLKTLVKEYSFLYNLVEDNSIEVFDISMMSYLLNPEQRDYSFGKISSQLKYGKDKHNFTGSNPAEHALEIKKIFLQEFEKADLTNLYKEIELPLIPLLARMEERGIMLDKKVAQDFLLEVQTELDNITKNIYEYAGGEFNIRSAQQTGDILFNKLKLPISGKTKGGQSSTSQDALEKLMGKHPIVDALLEYRKLEKLRSTYLEPLPKLVASDERIHTSFNQMATATGRLSSSNPNLQNIPIRGDLGKRMRECFIAEEGKSLISADYSQVELRVLAQYSQEETLVQAFKNDEDIHASTAALLNSVALDEVTKEQRSAAKTINFGLLYGMGARKLAQDIKVSMQEAKDFIETYFDRFKGIKSFFENSLEDAKKQGYVITIAGRRRPLPDLYSPSPQAKALAERQAVNTLIQGSAADIIKLAMLAVNKDEKLKELGAELLLQVHDELILSVPDANAKEAGERVAHLMSSVLPASIAGKDISFEVPLKVDYSAAKNWLLAH